MKTALTKVHDDILRSIDNKCSMILLLLDLSAVFDTVDRNTLLERLSQMLNSVLLSIDFFKKSIVVVRDWSKSIGGGGGPEHLEMWLKKTHDPPPPFGTKMADPPLKQGWKLHDPRPS